MKYKATYPPDLASEVRRLEQTLSTPTFNSVVLDAQRGAPPRPTPGMIAFADGVAWNPGAGIGLYVYHSGVWNFIA